MRRRQKDCSNRLAQRRYSHHHINFLRLLIDSNASVDGTTSEKLSTTYKSVVRIHTGSYSPFSCQLLAIIAFALSLAYPMAGDMHL
jgi:hypothetical protein